MINISVEQKREISDLKRAQILVGPIIESCVDVLFDIDGIVGKNQNRKEHGGEADGSFTEPQWTALRDIAQMVHGIVNKAQALGLVVTEAKPKSWAGHTGEAG